MSLILEALKKSEQQRRIGQVPTLGTPVFGTRRRRSLLPVLGLLIVAAVAIGAWLRFAPSRDAVPSASELARTESDTAGTTPPDAKGETGANAPAQNRAPANQAPPPPLSAYERERLRVTGVLPKSATDRKPRPPVSRGVVPPKPPTPATPAPGPVAPAVAPPAPKPPTPSPAPSGVAATPAAPPVPYLWELPFATRKDLPPLQISMHVYADDPKQRFAVIDGESYGEGDELGEGLIVKEIRPEGVVLDVAGKPFLLPAAGR